MKIFILTILILTLVFPSLSASDPVVIGAGDVTSCSNNRDALTADIIEGLPESTAITFGDNTQSNGTTYEFETCYNETWGTFKNRTHPSPGNHDYHAVGAAPYYAYFGVPEYYSYDIGTWHLISLNSQIDITADSPQLEWLEEDLTAHPNLCSLAYWHRPRFSSNTSNHPSDPSIGPIWNILYAHNVDIVLNGHNHLYERFGTQTPQGVADPNGIREFTVGTGGGGSWYSYGTPIANSEVINNTSYGVIKLTLHPEGYDWQFIPAQGYSFTDSGSDDCGVPTAVPICFPKPGWTTFCLFNYFPIIKK